MIPKLVSQNTKNDVKDLKRKVNKKCTIIINKGRKSSNIKASTKERIIYEKKIANAYCKG